jgi:hypothetical protein
MQDPDLLEKRGGLDFDARFEEFFQGFIAIRSHERLFPKECRTCGRKFANFCDYLFYTVPKGHVFEDCADVMRRQYTMMYRHCGCGNTLVLTLTEEVFPQLQALWVALKQLADQTGVPLNQVVTAFSDECDRFIVAQVCGE